ncbi:FecR domain-containing protein [Cytophagaceae bacterium YF14B1]|uniref:FecR domain-containing protein n=1 Tax=Xanthocytophaga flava TaxID=3048013 RepID=A0AAE3U5V6_9BACT|nr:FecR domain-containing protein [Xanthocytophaga flavus]MDJ1480676.1 FecR domain-containing protein [Xanthocytophaga flavus]
MDKKLLEKYRRGTCSEDEQQYVRHWIEDPANASLLYQWMQEQWYEMDIMNRPAIDLKPVWEKIDDHTKVSADIDFPESGSKVAQLTAFWKTRIRVAATIIAVLLGGIGGGWYFFGQHNDIIYQTSYGEVKRIVLPDSSVVVLNGNSTLHYPALWDNTHKREVWLEGEGFFSVRHKPDDQKFLVHTTDNFTIEVVGTQFSVFEQRGQTRVVLNNGKIKVHLKADINKKTSGLEIKPGELVEYNDRDQQLIRRKVNPEIYSSWKDNQLIFEDTPLSEVALRLERCYGLSVQLDETIKDKRLTGRMDIQNLDVLLEAMSSSFNLKVIQKKDSIIIHPNP